MTDDLDREVCLCFHVSLRKLKSHIRVEKPRRVAQMSDCFGAGTGCGWCRPFLQKLFESANRPDADNVLPGADEYAVQRCKYIENGGGKPPAGAS